MTMREAKNPDVERLELAKRFRAETDRLDMVFFAFLRKFDEHMVELIERIGQIEEGQASLMGQIASLLQRIDQIDLRLDRIKRHLDLR
jgi:hypothetical protein